MEVLTLMLDRCLDAQLLVLFALFLFKGEKGEVNAELKVGFFRFSIQAKGSRTDRDPR